MSDKSVCITSNLAATTSDSFSYTIPNGEKWVLYSFGCSDINLGDNKSSTFQLMWNGSVIKYIALTGNTFEVTINKEFVGDGVKSLQVQRFNASSSSKRCPFWITAIKRE